MGRRMESSREQEAVDTRCGALAQEDGSVRWRVWAPRAQWVDLVLLDGGDRRRLPMNPEPFGYFTHTEPHIAEGQRYAYSLDDGPELPDRPRAGSPTGSMPPQPFSGR